MHSTKPWKKLIAGTGIAVLVLAGCGGPSLHRRIHHPFSSLDPDCCPWLIGVKDAAPAGAMIVAEIGYGETGFSGKCSYPENMERLRLEACRLGADVVKLVAENQPNFLSTCYRVRATLYRLHAGLDSEPAAAALPETERGKCPSVLTRRFRDTPP